MIRKLFVITSIAAIVLAGCNGQAPSEVPSATSTETQAPTATEPPATEETPVSTDITATETAVTETPSTPEIDRPTNEPNCTNSASFVSDVTIPDNTRVGAGTPFTKTWRVRNTGTCIWGPDYTLSHYSDEAMAAPASVPLPLTFPGQDADISVDLTAPTSTGTHRGNFVIKNPDGLIMSVNDDSRLWLIINVTADTAVATAVTAASGTATTTSTVASSTSATASTTATCAFSSEPANITETLAAINAYREDNGLPPYRTNSQLSRAAQAHANDMACNSLFGHTGSNGSTIAQRVQASGYVYSYVTENVYGSYPPLTGQGVINWWINDKTDLRHNRNLISDTYIEIGIGYSFFNNFGYYVVVFGTP
jgi:uncharacterized protein YkwD